MRSPQAPGLPRQPACHGCFCSSGEALPLPVGSSHPNVSLGEHGAFSPGGVSPSPSSGRITPGEAAIMDDTDKPPQTGSYRTPPNLTKGGLVFEFLHLGRQRLIDFGRCPSKRLSEGREPEEPPCRAASLAGDLQGASAEGEASPLPASRALRGGSRACRLGSSPDRAGIGRRPPQCHCALSQ